MSLVNRQLPAAWPFLPCSQKGPSCLRNPQMLWPELSCHHPLPQSPQASQPPPQWSPALSPGGQFGQERVTWWATRLAWACGAVSPVANVLLVALGLSPHPALPACAPQQNTANTNSSHTLGGWGEATGLEGPRWTGAHPAGCSDRPITD